MTFLLFVAGFFHPLFWLAAVIWVVGNVLFYGVFSFGMLWLEDRTHDVRAGDKKPLGQVIGEVISGCALLVIVAGCFIAWLLYSQ